ncbi:hypothetical protein SEF58_12230 [Neomoorella humiferrea]
METRKTRKVLFQVLTKFQGAYGDNNQSENQQVEDLEQQVTEADAF